MEAEVDEPAGKGTSGEQQCKKKDAGQCTERSEILYAAAVPEPGGFPLGWIKRLMLDEQSVFIKAERLFELDQDLLGQSVTMLLLKDQAAKQPAPNQAAQREEQRFGRRQPAFERTQEERKGHRNERECPEGCEAYHLLTTLIDLVLVQRIEDDQSLLYAFRDHDRIAGSQYPNTVILSSDDRPANS
jgi:hypothetical protein